VGVVGCGGLGGYGVCERWVEAMAEGRRLACGKGCVPELFIL